MSEHCPECGGAVYVDSLCTWGLDDQGNRESIGDFQPDDLDAARCMDDDECGGAGLYAELI